MNLLCSKPFDKTLQYSQQRADWSILCKLVHHRISAIFELVIEHILKEKYSANKKFWDSWNSTVTIFHLSWFELVWCIMYIYCATSYVILIERNKISSCKKKSSLENSSRAKSSATPLVGLNRSVVANLKNTIEESMKTYPLFISFPFRTNL